MDNLPKVISIRMYQPVYLGQKLKTFVNLDNLKGSGFAADAKVTLEVVPGMGVRLEDENDAIIVSFNNLASIGVEKSKPSLKKSITK